MKKMNIPLMATLLVLSIIVCPILYFAVGPMLDASQLEVTAILWILPGSRWAPVWSTACMCPYRLSRSPATP